MPIRVRLLFSTMFLTLFLTAAIPLFTELSRPKDIWWTPHGMLVPLAQSSDRVEVYVRGKPLATAIEAGELQIAGEGGSGALTTSDVAFRFNNWDRVRAERLPLQLVRASAAGAMACLFLLILTGRLAYRGERKP